MPIILTNKYWGVVFMNIPYVFKKCTVCGRWLVASTYNFHRTKSGRYGLASQCKECRNKENKKWRLENKDKITEISKQYYENNKHKILENRKQYYETNKDKILENRKQYYKQYYQSPQGQVTYFNSYQRRRAKEEEQGTGITKDQWLEMMKFFDFRCAYSEERLTKDTRSVDHIVPLNSNGEHEIWNLVPMAKSLNSSKQDKDMLEWYREQSFYNPNRLAKIYKWQEYAFNKWGKDTEYFNSGDIQIKLI